MTSERIQQRSQHTREALMNAAESLIADKGIENVTARAIMSLASQRNESALQYHFGNFRGLLRAIGERRNAQVEERRQVLLDSLVSKGTRLTLRDICRLMIGPAFLLAQEDPGFLLYVKGFGRELALSDTRASQHMNRDENPATMETRRMLFEALEHMDEDTVTDRFEHAVRFIGLSMSRHARTPGAFHGRSGELFMNRLADMTAGLFSAETSTG